MTSKALRSAKEEQQELEALHRLDEECVYQQQAGNYLKAFDCMERALVLRQHFFGVESPEVLHACKALAEMCNLLSMSFLQQDNYAVTIDLLKKAEILSKHHASERATTLNNLACYYRRLGKLHAAMSCLKRAIEIEKKLQNVRNVADTHLNICAVLSQLGKHQQALEQAQEALIILQEEFFLAKQQTPAPTDAKGAARAKADSNGTEDPSPSPSATPTQQLDRVSVMCIAYHNIGVEQEFLKDYTNSIVSYKKGVGLAEQYLGVDHAIATTVRNSYLAAKRTIATKPVAGRHRPGSGAEASKSPGKVPLRLISSPRSGGSTTDALRHPSPLTKEKQRHTLSDIPTPRSIVAEVLSRGSSLPPLDGGGASASSPDRGVLSPRDPFFSPRFRFNDGKSVEAASASEPSSKSPRVTAAKTKRKKEVKFQSLPPDEDKELPASPQTNNHMKPPAVAAESAATSDRSGDPKDSPAPRSDSDSDRNRDEDAASETASIQPATTREEAPEDLVLPETSGGDEQSTRAEEQQLPGPIDLEAGASEDPSIPAAALTASSNLPESCEVPAPERVLSESVPGDPHDSGQLRLESAAADSLDTPPAAASDRNDAEVADGELESGSQATADSAPTERAHDPRDTDDILSLLDEPTGDAQTPLGGGADAGAEVEPDAAASARRDVESESAEVASSSYDAIATYDASESNGAALSQFGPTDDHAASDDRVAAEHDPQGDAETPSNDADEQIQRPEVLAAASTDAVEGHEDAVFETLDASPSPEALEAIEEGADQESSQSVVEEPAAQHDEAGEAVAPSDAACDDWGEQQHVEQAGEYEYWAEDTAQQPRREDSEAPGDTDTQSPHDPSPGDNGSASLQHSGDRDADDAAAYTNDSYESRDPSPDPQCYEDSGEGEHYYEDNGDGEHYYEDVDAAAEHGESPSEREQEPLSLSDATRLGPAFALGGDADESGAAFPADNYDEHHPAALEGDGVDQASWDAAPDAAPE